MVKFLIEINDDGIGWEMVGVFLNIREEVFKNVKPGLCNRTSS
ncbi:hypothetical protein [Saccharicrinis sp. GN24d3]